MNRQETNNQELREAISQITRRYSQLSEKHLQIEAIESLRTRYRHTIRCWKPVRPEDPGTHYCCFEYAFNRIDQHQKFIRNRIGKRISVDSDFAAWLIQEGLIKRQDEP